MLPRLQPKKYKSQSEAWQPVRFLIDENLSHRLVQVLEEKGHDAVHAYTAGLGGKSDPEVRRLAIAQNRILLSLDADFANLKRFPVIGTPGVIWIKVSPPVTFDNIERQIEAALAVIGENDMANRLLIVERGRVRSRFGALR